jgi:hypothetical protein
LSVDEQDMLSQMDAQDQRLVADRMSQWADNFK